MPSSLHRRAFLKTGIGAATLAAIPFERSLAALARSEGFESLAASVGVPRLCVIDRRFARAAAFAGAFAGQSVETVSFAGDLTRLWARDLDLRFRQKPEVTIGMTTAGALDCLQLLSAGYRMRVLDRAEVEPLPQQDLLVTWVLAPLNNSKGIV